MANRDLTKGEPGRILRAYCLPMFGSVFFQQMYNLADSFTAGRFIGEAALAAVGNSYELTLIYLAFALGCNTGASMVVARYFGAKRYDRVKTAIFTALIATGVVCVALLLAGMALAAPLLRAIRTPSNTFRDSITYLKIYTAALPFVFFYNVTNGIFSALGDSKTPIYFLILSSVINVALDFLSVGVLDMGVAGPAWATVISQAISGLLCLFIMFRRYPVLRMTASDLKPRGKYMLRLCSIGVPMGLQYSITAIGTIVIQAAVNALAPAYIAAVTVGNKLNQLFGSMFDAMGTTMSVYGAQNYGAMKLDRLHKGVGSCVLLAVIYSLVTLPILIFFGADLSMLFIDAAEPLATRLQIASYAREFMIWNGAFYISLSLVNILRFTIQGLSFTKQAIFAGIFEMIARCVVGFWLADLWGYTAICFANPAAWILADLFLIPAYFHSVKVLKRRRAERVPA